MSAALLPVPFFEGPEKRVEIRYVVADDLERAAGRRRRTDGGLRNVPAAHWAASLAKAGITIESSVHGPEWDCYMLSESSLFVGRDRIICKTCGRSAPLAIVDDALRCASDVGAEPTLVLFSRSDLLRPEEQTATHRSFAAECRFLDAVLPSDAVANAAVLGDAADSHWAVYLASLPAAAGTAGYVPPTLEMAMYDLDPTQASVWWAKNVGTAEAARHLSGLDAVMPADGTIDEMLFAPCGYSMNSCDNLTGAHATVHVTPQEVCSFASYECTVLDPTAVGATIRSVIDVFKPGRFSISLSDLADPELEQFAALAIGSVAGDSCDYAVSDHAVERLSCGSMRGSQVFASFVATPMDLTMDLPADFPLGIAAHQQQLEHVPDLSTLLAAYGVPVIDECVDSQMFRQHISENDLDAPFYIADLGAVEKRFRLWQKLLPRIEPRYAVKCNPDEILLGTLHALGCGFDAASEAEMRLAFKAGADVDKIVFANPVKGRSCIDYARKHGVGLTTFDSAAELEKLAEHWPDAQLLLRISTDDSGASCQLSNKYGAQLGEEVHGLILLARSLQLEIVGVAFHCGSGQTQSVAFGRAIVDAAAVFDQLRLVGFSPHILDIGGGFPGEDAQGVATFDEIAGSITAALSVHFPEYDIDGPDNPQPLRVIAEPGRFFAQSAFTLACNIIGTKHIQRPADAVPAPEDIVCSYTIGDGIYGSFNNLMYDHAEVTPVPLKLSDDIVQRAAPAATVGMAVAAGAAAVPHSADLVASTVFGPTCDGLDCVCKQVMLPPDLAPGRDWLLFEGMGAYTLAAGSNFNGIQRAMVKYIYSSNGNAALDGAGSYVKDAREEITWGSPPQAVMVATSSTSTKANTLPRSRL